MGQGQLEFQVGRRRIDEEIPRAVLQPLVDGQEHDLAVARPVGVHQFVEMPAFARAEVVEADAERFRALALLELVLDGLDCVVHDGGSSLSMFPGRSPAAGPRRH
ncbi:MAG: hypothetical protein A2Y56_10480 [Candidatus Aminicenantes bacterium RBG_13_63_10]|nr:MAG: hypothetical protein A2Y56_10480 [Candidatus Aminicenantes bacterium RBG_13_63_10]